MIRRCDSEGRSKMVGELLGSKELIGTNGAWLAAAAQANALIPLKIAGTGAVFENITQSCSVSGVRPIKASAAEVKVP